MFIPARLQHRHMDGDQRERARKRSRTAEVRVSVEEAAGVAVLEQQPADLHSCAGQGDVGVRSGQQGVEPQAGSSRSADAEAAGDRESDRSDETGCGILPVSSDDGIPEDEFVTAREELLARRFTELETSIPQHNPVDPQIYRAKFVCTKGKRHRHNPAGCDGDHCWMWTPSWKRMHWLGGANRNQELLDIMLRHPQCFATLGRDQNGCYFWELHNHYSEA